MGDPAVTLEERVTELEIRLAYHERLTAELDGVIRELGDELQRARRLLSDTIERLDAATDDDGRFEGEVD